MLPAFTTSPQEYLAVVNPHSVQDCLNSPAGTLAKIEKERGAQFVQVVLVNLISDLCLWFNFNRTMNQKQIMETAKILMEKYGQYTPEDFILCFKKIKGLEYGKMMEGIDGAKILDMVGEYDKERDDEIMRMRQKETHDHKAEGKFLSDVTYKVMKSMQERGELDRKPRPVIDNPLDKMMKGYIAEFDKLHDEQFPGKSGIRFVNFGGKMIDVTEYCNTRFLEENPQEDETHQ